MALESGQQILAFHSNDVFAPWWIIYTPPDGTDLDLEKAGWRREGFWGYQHLIEHQFLDFDFRREPRIVALDGRPKLSLNMDDRLDKREPLCIKPVLSYLEARNTVYEVVSVRTTKVVLGRELRQESLADQIMYFCCHGDVLTDQEGGRAQLTLGDDEPIQVSDFEDWLWQKPFTTNPVIFINACHGTRMSTSFYTSFGPVLMKARANCLIGPQIEVPRVLAADYAIRLFGRFATGEHLGVIMRDLARGYLDECRNPLGLIFGLYGSMDARLVLRRSL